MWVSSVDTSGPQSGLSQSTFQLLRKTHAYLQAYPRSECIRKTEQPCLKFRLKHLFEVEASFWGHLPLEICSRRTTYHKKALARSQTPRKAPSTTTGTISMKVFLMKTAKTPKTGSFCMAWKLYKLDGLNTTPHGLTLRYASISEFNIKHHQAKNFRRPRNLQVMT